MTVWICGFHLVQFCTCKRKFKGTVPRDFWLQFFLMNQFPPSPWVNLQRWSSNCFCRSANSWAQSAIANSQISEICESANFFSLIRKLHIHKFCWWASPRIANLQIFHHKTERIVFFFIKFPPFMANYLKVCCKCAAHIGMGGVKIEKEPRQWDEYVYRIS